MKAIMIPMAVAGCVLVEMACAADALQVELKELHCQYEKKAASIVQMPPCVVTLAVSSASADAELCGLDTNELTATDAKGNQIKVRESAMPMTAASEAGEKSSQDLMLQLFKLPKGGSVTLSGSLTARLAGGTDTADPQAFDVKKGGSFTSCGVSYTLAEGKAMTFFGLGEQSDTAVEMKTENQDAIRDVQFTTADGKYVKINGRMSTDKSVTYMLATKETALRIVVSVYKDVQTVSCPVNMTFNLSGEVKKKSAEPAAEDQAKPKQKKPKKK